MALERFLTMKPFRYFNKTIGIAMTTIGALITLSATAQAQITQAPFELGMFRPKLVVLIHGVTPEPREDPEAGIVTSRHARYYWGYDFIKGLQGRMADQDMKVITPKINGELRIVPTEKEDWYEHTPDSTVFDMAPVCFPQGWLNNIPPSVQNNQKFIKDYIRLMTQRSGNYTMVMVNTRDGSRHLMPQLGEFIDETYLSYKAMFNHLPINQQPQIYLVGHSFGGIIARGLLANPTKPDLFGNTLSASQRSRADFLRERVVLVQTLASPHEGTLVPDVAGDIADYIAENGFDQIYNVMNEIPIEQFENMTEEEMRQAAKDLVQTALDAISGKRDCLQDLLRMNEYNKGILHPSTALRRNTTRGLANQLVPIYTAGGRNPGGMYFDQIRSTFYLGGGRWNPVTAIDYLFDGTRPAKEATALYLIQALMHYDGFGWEPKMPWGPAEYPDGDRVSTPFVGIGPIRPRSLTDDWQPTYRTLNGVVKALFQGKPYDTTKSDGEWDSDGFLGWDSAHAYHIPNKNFFRVFEESKYGDMLPWDIDNHGSIMFNPGVGLWIHNELIRNAGPYIINNQVRRSVWGPLDIIENPSSSIKLEVLEIHDVDDDLDPPGNDADFTLNVRLGANTQTRVLPDGQRTVTDIDPFFLSRYRSTVIPIRIDAIERDTGSYDDICVMSPQPGKTSLYLFYDTISGRITGDAEGEAGEIISIKPVWWNGPSNRVSCKIRITSL